MQIGKDDLLAGVPAKLLRDVLTKMGNDSWSQKKLRDELKLPPTGWAGVLAMLKAHGHCRASSALTFSASKCC